MKKLSRIIVGSLGLLAVALPIAFAEAASLSITSLSPGSTVTAKDGLTFKISPSGFEVQSYQLSDSFPGSSVSRNNITGAGNFFWVPGATDIGTHVLTITATNSLGDAATATQTIVVAPLPAISIQSLSPGGSVMPGTKVSFIVSSSGLVNSTYSLGDSFSGSSVGNVGITSSGLFSWTPEIAQNGDHTITIYATDSTGHSATASQLIRVGAGPTLAVSLLTPGTSVPLGSTVTFSVIPTNYSPTSYSVTDTFSGSTVSNFSISATGQFSWMPQGSDVGVHTLTVKGTVGAFGDSALVTQTITVVGSGTATPTTTATTGSNTSLSVLQAQLAALLAKTSTSGNAPVPAASTAPSFTTNLHSGSESDEVLRLQAVLANLGFFSGTPNGYFGPQTMKAVKAFQAAHKLEQLGSVGPGTRAALNALSGTPTASSSAASSGNGYVFKNFMGPGEDSSDGPDVMELQKRLTSLGFLTATPTGSFGPATEAAVKKFQKAKGLPAVGYVGSATRAALNQ